MRDGCGRRLEQRAAEEAFEGIVRLALVRRFRLPGGSLLDGDLAVAHLDHLVVELHAEGVDAGLADLAGAHLPGLAEGARQGAVAVPHVVVLVGAADDVQVLELEIGAESEAAQAGAAHLDGEDRDLPDADHRRLQGRLDDGVRGVGGQTGGKTSGEAAGGEETSRPAGALTPGPHTR